MSLEKQFLLVQLACFIPCARCHVDAVTWTLSHEDIHQSGRAESLVSAVFIDRQREAQVRFSRPHTSPDSSCNHMSILLRRQSVLTFNEVYDIIHVHSVGVSHII